MTNCRKYHLPFLFLVGFLLSFFIGYNNLTNAANCVNKWTSERTDCAGYQCTGNTCTMYTTQCSGFSCTGGKTWRKVLCEGTLYLLWFYTNVGEDGTDTDHKKAADISDQCAEKYTGATASCTGSFYNCTMPANPPSGCPTGPIALNQNIGEWQTDYSCTKP